MLKQIITVLFLITIIYVPVAFSESLKVEYSEPLIEEEDEEYTHPALIIDNQAYLKELEERRKAAALNPGLQMVVIQKGSENSKKDRKYCPHRCVCGEDDSWEVRYTSGNTSLYYGNGISVNNCNKYYWIKRPKKSGKSRKKSSVQ